jgi:hypothetical protein
MEFRSFTNGQWADLSLSRHLVYPENRRNIMDQGPQGPQGSQGGPSFRQAAEGVGAPKVPQGIAQGQHPQAAGLTAVPIPKTYTFFLRHTSEFSGLHYEGQFACRKMALRDFARIGVRKTQLNGGFHHDLNNPGCGISEDVDTLNNMIAHLEIALIQWPTWWNLDECDDPDLLKVIFNNCVTFENSFLSKRDESQPGGSVPHDSSGAGSESGSDGSVEEVGGSQVQSSLEP